LILASCAPRVTEERAIEMLDVFNEEEIEYILYTNSTYGNNDNSNATINATSGTLIRKYNWTLDEVHYLSEAASVGYYLQKKWPENMDLQTFTTVAPKPTASYRKSFTCNSYFGPTQMLLEVIEYKFNWRVREDARFKDSPVIKTFDHLVLLFELHENGGRFLGRVVEDKNASIANFSLLNVSTQQFNFTPCDYF
jgi:hypothetical protein